MCANNLGRRQMRCKNCDKKAQRVRQRKEPASLQDLAGNVARRHWKMLEPREKSKREFTFDLLFRQVTHPYDGVWKIPCESKKNNYKRYIPRLREFLTGGQGELMLKDLSSKERKSCHEAAERFALDHSSRGQGSSRVLVVTRPKG